jgi:hypothetical protein
MSLISQYIVNDPQFLSKHLKAQMCFVMVSMPWELASSASQLWSDFKSLFIYLYSARCKIERLLQKIQPAWYCKNTFMICKTYLFFLLFLQLSNNYSATLHQLHLCIAAPLQTSASAIDRLLSADGYSGSNKQPMHNFPWSDSIASARASVILRSLLHSGYHDMELRRILKTHLKLLTGKCNEDFFQDNFSDITGILSLLCTYPTTSYCSNHWTTRSLHPWWDCGCQMTGP